MSGLSSFVLPDDSALRREIVRPESMRSKDYLEKYDFTTVFFDAFRSGNYVHFCAPPLLNFKDTFLAALNKAAGSAKLKYRARGRVDEVWLKIDARELNIDFAGQRKSISVQPNLSEFFAGRRVLFTKSKNNDPRWISDWVQFHVKNQGADAVLIYDNGSDRYDPAEIEKQLAAKFPSMVIKVVIWPFKWGQANADYHGWDSDFCQYGILNHARFRYLAKARSVLSCDVDELIMAEECAGTVFKAAERSLIGFVTFDGHWMSEASARDLSESRYHSDFVHRMAPPKDRSERKWCAVPSRLPHSWSWDVHIIRNPFGFIGFTPDIRIRHFLAISTSWRSDRSRTRPPVDEDHLIDGPLVRALQHAEIL